MYLTGKKEVILKKEYLDVYECSCRRPTKFIGKIEDSPKILQHL